MGTAWEGVGAAMVKMGSVPSGRMIPGGQVGVAGCARPERRRDTDAFPRDVGAFIHLEGPRADLRMDASDRARCRRRAFPGHPPPRWDQSPDPRKNLEEHSRRGCGRGRRRGSGDPWSSS